MSRGVLFHPPVRLQLKDAAMRRASMRLLVAIVCLLSIAGAAGCKSSDYLNVRRVPRNPLEVPLQLLSWSGPKPTDRTKQLLRRFSIAQDGDLDGNAVSRLQEEIDVEPTPDKVYALSEVAYIIAKRDESQGKSTVAFNRYALAVANAYQYLFDPRFDVERNPYDPQFRRVCDVYNGSLEAALRIITKQGGVTPNSSYNVRIGDDNYVLDVVLRGPWHEEDFERFEFVSDYEINGLSNRHHTYGLGVPLIAVRRPHEQQDPAEKYYPKGLSFPITAFLRVPKAIQGDGARHCTLELVDPMVTTSVRVANYHVPLETDISTPLGYFLDHPELKSHGKSIATMGFLNAESASKAQGLYMLEPYDPNKIPVLMVHGLWSSPLTWMEMFNDLRSFPELRQRYQFWFYLYPTGQPFWVSAANLRDDLAQMRKTLDRNAENVLLDQMVLVGHSMGGLVSRMQTLESRNDYWSIISDRPFGDLEASEEVRDRLANTLFFSPDPSIRHVITLGTPHRGSDYSNDFTRWIARKMIELPGRIMRTAQELTGRNPSFFRNTELINETNSIDSLSPRSPIFGVMDQSPTAPWTRYHNIIGVVPSNRFLSRISGHGDGIVSYESARIEDASSELVVDADHTGVHRHPRSILEVRRILRGHIQEFDIAQREQRESSTVSPRRALARPASAIRR